MGKQDEKIGGGYTFHMSIIEGLMKVQSDHEFYFYYKSKKKLFENNNSNIKFTNMKFEYITKIKKKLFYKKIKKYETDLNTLILRDNIELVYFISPFYEEVKAPFVLTVWDLGHRKESSFPEVSFCNNNFFSRENFYSKILMQASYIVIGNNEGKKQLEGFYNIEPRRIKTIPMPTPNYVYEIQEDLSILGKYGLEKNKYLFYPVQFWAHKNHIRLVKAMKKLKEQGLNFKFVFTGSNQGNLEYIKEKVKESGLEKEVLFLGFVKKEEIIALYKNAYALTYASFLGPDNIPPLEAMALRCPVICSDIDGMREQLGDCALFFNPIDEDDLIEKIKQLENNELRQSLIQKGEILAKNCSVENYITKMTEIIEDFVPIRECWSSTERYIQ